MNRRDFFQGGFIEVIEKMVGGKNIDLYEIDVEEDEPKIDCLYYTNISISQSHI